MLEGDLTRFAHGASGYARRPERHQPRRKAPTASKADDTKGRLKEAAGTLSGDKDLEREGKLDQAGGAVKKKAERAGDKVDDAVDAVKEKLDRDR